MTDFRIGTGNPVNFFQKVTVTNTSFGTSANNFKSDILIPFTTAGFSLSNEGSGVVQVSYDGYNVGDELDSSLTTKFVQYDNRVACKIWLKVASGSAAVAVRAWSIR